MPSAAADSPNRRPLPLVAGLASGALRWLAPLGALLLLVALWQAVVLTGRVGRFVLPPPLAVWEALIASAPTLAVDTWVTLVATLAGFALSIAVAVPLALLIVLWPPMRTGLYPLLLLGQSVPKQSIAPVLLLWVGFGETHKVLLAFLTAFFPIVVNTAVGLQMTPPEMVDLGRLFSASRWRLFMKVTFPSAMPYFFAGLKVAISLAIVGTVIGEFINSERGLGTVILVATANANTALAFAAIGVLSLLGILLFGAISLLERIVCPWYGKEA